MVENWVEFDLVKIVLARLRAIDVHLDRVSQDPTAWLNIVTETKGATQCALVAALAGTTNHNVERRIEAGNSGLPFDPSPYVEPKVFLAPIGVLLARAAKRRDDGSRLISKSERKLVARLATRFRNEFEHFAPQTFAIEMSGFPAMVDGCIAVVERLMQDWSTRHASDAERGELPELTRRCRSKLNTLHRSYLVVDEDTAPA